jgi:hypothetical protein
VKRFTQLHLRHQLRKFALARRTFDVPFASDENQRRGSCGEGYPVGIFPAAKIMNPK